MTHVKKKVIHQINREWRMVAPFSKLYGKIWVGFSLNTGKRFFLEVSFQMQQRKSIRVYSTGVSNRSFYPIFNKRFDHLETLLTICRTKNVLSAGSLCGPLVPIPQSKCPKRTFMLPQKYRVSVWNMLSTPLKCFMENEN